MVDHHVLATSSLLDTRLTVESGPVEGPSAALLRATSAADYASERLPADAPERQLWRQHAGALTEGLHAAWRRADAETREAISVQLDDIAETSRGPLELLRRTIVLARHAHDLAGLSGDPRIPPVVRRRSRALQFRLFDRVARVRRDPELEALAGRRNEVMIGLGLRPRSITLLDWCAVAVRIALGSPLRETLAAMAPDEAERILAAKLRFDLLAIELNIALDDLADEGRDPGLFALTVDRALGPALRPFDPARAVGRYLLQRGARAEAELEARPEHPGARYVALVTDLYRGVVDAGRALAGDRWDEARWAEQMRRILGAMALSIVQNERPRLLRGVDWSADFSGRDHLSVQAANGNRVVFELVGLWCHERITGRHLPEQAAARMLGAFEDLQIAQQLGNCLATFERELDEGDRSNGVVEQVAQAWRSMTADQRCRLTAGTELGQHLEALSISVSSEDPLEALYRVLRRGDEAARARAKRSIRALVERCGAIHEVLGQWERRVDTAATVLHALGFDGGSSRRAQVDLLLLHLLLLGKSPLADHGERH